MPLSHSPQHNTQSPICSTCVRLLSITFWALYVISLSLSSFNFLPLSSSLLTLKNRLTHFYFFFPLLSLPFTLHFSSINQHSLSLSPSLLECFISGCIFITQNSKRTSVFVWPHVLFSHWFHFITKSNRERKKAEEGKQNKTRKKKFFIHTFYYKTQKKTTKKKHKCSKEKRRRRKSKIVYAFFFVEFSNIFVSSSFSPPILVTLFVCKNISQLFDKRGKKEGKIRKKRSFWFMVHFQNIVSFLSIILICWFFVLCLISPFVSF